MATSPAAREAVLLQAIYSFKGSHNDELNFKKDDLITLTQKEDGGWWEGTTSDGKTGWFPANYVREVASAKRAPEETTPKSTEYRQQVLRDLLQKEEDFVSELRKLERDFVVPMHRSEILKESEFRQLFGNLDELTEVHSSMNSDVASAIRGVPNPREQRVGRALLQHGAAVRSAHQTYWANHPKAVCVLERHRDRLNAFMENLGAQPPGLMYLTTVLSKPLRHLEKYSGLVQELEKHLEVDHPDRGDTQRSIGFFKAVSSECAKLRRQKELELEVLSGSIRNWEGPEPLSSSLGEILHMGAVTTMDDRKDRYFVLFNSYLVKLSVSARMSAFIFEGKLPLSGIAVNRLEDTEDVVNAFEVSGPAVEQQRVVVTCQSKVDSLKWVELIQQATKLHRQSHFNGGNNSTSSSGLQNLRPHNVGGKGYLWKMSCLRPAPPTRSYIGADDKRGKKKDPDTTYEEDMQILRVIEAYYTANKRNTQVASALIENPPVMLIDEEKIISDEFNHGLSEEKNVVDTVYNVRDQVLRLNQQTKDILKSLEDEVAARKKLEAYVRSLNLGKEK